MKDTEKWKSHMGELLAKGKEFGVRLVISSSRIQGRGFSPDHLSPEHP